MKMTLMQLIPLPDENLISFMQLRRGETFRYPNGERVYMVTRSGSYQGQAVNLSDGAINDFYATKPVRRVEVIAHWKTIECEDH